MKTVKNTTSDGATKNVKDIKFWGNKDSFRLISKAWSEEEGWMKSTKALEIHGYGCIVQVSTQQGDNVAEAVVFVPGIKISESTDDNNNIISRKLIKL